MRITCLATVFLTDDERVDVNPPHEPKVTRRIVRVVASIGPGVGTEPEISLYGVRVYATGEPTKADAPVFGVMQQALDADKSGALHRAIDSLREAHRALGQANILPAVVTKPVKAAVPTDGVPE